MSDFQTELQHRSAAIRRRATAPDASTERAGRVHPLVRLQGLVGNAQVARLVAQRQDIPEEDDLQPKHDPALVARAAEEEEMPPVQSKHDPALLSRQPEEEEEMPPRAKHDPALQRAEAEEDELALKRDPSLLQREVTPTIGLEGGPVGDDLARRIDSVRGTGSGLSEATRSQMEPAFGADFSGVRVHQDSESDTLARSMTAKAFTTGSDIFLRNDVNAGDSSLLAHELTHVVQQSSGETGGGSGDGMRVGPAGDPLEQQADSVAQSIVSGAGAQRHVEEGRPSSG